ARLPGRPDRSRQPLRPRPPRLPAASRLHRRRADGRTGRPRPHRHHGGRQLRTPSIVDDRRPKDGVFSAEDAESAEDADRLFSDRAFLHFRPRASPGLLSTMLAGTSDPSALSASSAPSALKTLVADPSTLPARSLVGGRRSSTR